MAIVREIWVGRSQRLAHPSRRWIFLKDGSLLMVGGFTPERSCPAGVGMLVAGVRSSDRKVRDIDIDSGSAFSCAY